MDGDANMKDGSHFKNVTTTQQQLWEFDQCVLAQRGHPETSHTRRKIE